MRARSSRVSWDRYGVVILLVVGAVGAAALAYVIGNEAKPKSDTIKFEFYKLLLQALLIGAVGGALGAAFREDRRRRDAEDRRREFIRDRLESILRDVDEDYMLIRRSRRTLRDQSPIPHSRYRTEMTNLEDIERSLGEVQNNIENLQALADLDLAGLRQVLERMKEYLDQLRREYELLKSRPDEEIGGVRMPQLSAFLAPTGTGSFRSMTEFYRLARNLVIAQLSGLAGSRKAEEMPAAWNRAR